ncbi:MAG TPA: YsnF/AvaK domain-containing protein [Tepidisphaeraceae bacterium]|nr:YsnF/AvaK domain-containing protein [Tepidisphaeraceae bacterium]
MADKVVAFFQTKQQAEAARDELRAAGYDRDDTKIFGGDGPGFWQNMKEAFGFADAEDQYMYEEAARRGAYGLLVELDDADAPSAQTAVTILQRHQPLDLDTQAQQWRQEGWKGGASTQTASTDTAAAARTQVSAGQQQHHAAAQTQNLAEGQQAIPVVEEQLRVGKRAVNRGGLRIHSRVTEVPVQEQVHLRQERAVVERRPVDRPLGAGDSAFQERNIEVTERGEEAVIGKEARVVEEVVVGKQVEDRTETVRDTVRRQDVEVEKLNPNHAAGTGRAFSADEYTTELYRDQRFAGRDWTTVESDVRTDYERRYGHTGSTWENVKDSISRGWQNLKAKV